MSNSPDIDTRIAMLLEGAQLPGTLRSVSPCAVSGNNRTYRVTTTQGMLAAKQYFRHEGDQRDRLGTEFAFLTFAEKAAPGSVPAPLAIDREQGLALYEFVEGHPVQPHEVTWSRVQSAVTFFLALNSPKSRAHAQDLPAASEACFSVDAHLAVVNARLANLRTAVPDLAENRLALELVERISGYWATLSSHVLATAAAAGLRTDAILESDQRCISPSDFGFHNALIAPDLSTRFLDFEYAGWDDPAKMAGDFFAQLAVPVPAEYFDPFVQEISSAFPDPEGLSDRARILRPVYQVKWCCIALNVFLPTHLARRKFADPNREDGSLQREQVAKAELLFQSLPVH